MPVLPQTREGESTSQTGVRSHRFVPRTLGTRLALTYAGLTLLIMAALAWSLAGVIRDFYIGQLREDLLQETVLAADLLAPALIPPVTVSEIDAIADRLGADLDARVTVVAADGAVLGDSESDPSRMDNHRTRPEIQEAIARGTGSSVRSSSTVQAPFFYVARSVAPGGEIVRLGIPLEVVEGLVESRMQQPVEAHVSLRSAPHVRHDPTDGAGAREVVPRRLLCRVRISVVLRMWRAPSRRQTPR